MPGFLDAITASLGGVTGLALPVWCAGCGVADAALCPACSAMMRAPARDVRDLAGGLPPHWRGAVPPLVAVARYETVVRSVLVSWKDHGRSDLTPHVGWALARALLGAVVSAGYASPPGGEPHGVEPGPGAGHVLGVVPVPSSGAATRRRGEDLLVSATRHATALAEPVLASKGLSITVIPLLRQRRGVADQAGLSATDRAANLAGRLVLAHPPPPGMRLILVDDVVTTGASLREATTVLAGRRGPVPVVGAAVVAVTPHAGR